MIEPMPDVLQLLVQHEVAIKQLYEAFAATFAHRREFWQGLAADEQRHADSLGTLRLAAATKQLLERIRPQAIKSSIAYVESQAIKARARLLTLLQALALARDFETALLEKQFAVLIGAASKEVGAVITGLVAETEQHRKAILEAIAGERR